MNKFDFPNIDHLIEGVHYTVIDWDFADGAERVKSAKDCKPGQRVVFGRCADVGKSPDEEVSRREQEQTKSGKAATNIGGPMIVKGQKMGWAIKDGKPVLVDWGSVAGEAKVGPKIPSTPAKQAGRSRSSGQIKGLRKALESPNLNDSARKSIEDQIRELGG